MNKNDKEKLIKVNRNSMGEGNFLLYKLLKKLESVIINDPKSELSDWRN